jgi:hypothetical protein
LILLRAFLVACFRLFFGRFERIWTVRSVHDAHGRGQARSESRKSRKDRKKTYHDEECIVPRYHDHLVAHQTALFPPLEPNTPPERSPTKWRIADPVDFLVFSWTHTTFSDFILILEFSSTTHSIFMRYGPPEHSPPWRPRRPLSSNQSRFLDLLLNLVVITM